MPFVHLNALNNDQNYSLAMSLFSCIEGQLVYLSRRMYGKGYYQLNFEEKKALVGIIVQCPTDDLTIKPTCSYLNDALYFVLSNTTGQWLEKISPDELIHLLDEIVQTAYEYIGVTEEVLCNSSPSIQFIN